MSLAFSTRKTLTAAVKILLHDTCKNTHDNINVILTVLLELVVDALQDGRELLAGGAPASAEVHSQHLALQRLRGYLGSIRLRP